MLYVGMTGLCQNVGIEHRNRSGTIPKAASVVKQIVPINADECKIPQYLSGYWGNFLYRKCGYVIYDAGYVP